jgi:hypothetical protein
LRSTFRKLRRFHSYSERIQLPSSMSLDLRILKP